MKVFLGSTLVDKHNEVIELCELQKIVNKVNGTRAVQIGVNHDLTLPPKGKLRDARIVEIPGSHFEAWGVADFFDSVERTPSKYGELVHEKLSSDLRGLALASTNEPHATSVHLDRNSFNSMEEFEYLRSNLEQIADSPAGGLSRKALENLPEIHIQIGLLELWIFCEVQGKGLLSKIWGKVVDEFSDEVVSRGKGVLTKFIGLLAKQDSNIILNVPFHPKVQLFVRNSATSHLHEIITPEIIADRLKDAEYFKSTFGAELVQFSFEENEWIFTYLLTKSGGTIGTPKIMEKRDQIYSVVTKDGNKFSLGAYNKFED